MLLYIRLLDSRRGAYPSAQEHKAEQLPISISINSEHAIHVIDFAGAVRFSELVALGRTHADNPTWAGADTLHIVDDAADLSQLTNAQLDTMRAHYRKLHQSIEFFLLRRSGWVCRSADACRVVEYWLQERHSRDGQGTEVLLAMTLDGLADLFSPHEIQAVASRSGFIEYLRIDHTLQHPDYLRHIRQD